MQKPAIPKNESKRQAALRGLNVLDTPAEARFDRITRIAQQHFQVSIALVSLVDEDRQWFKSRQGLDATETPRDISFCGHAILSEDIFYIPNALEDPRFADNPLVTGPPKIRFYAGAPLHAPNGQRVGTLCIIDDKPREFSSEELAVLRNLANDVEKALLKRSSSMGFTLAQKIGLSSVFLVLLSGGVVGGLFYNKTTDLLVDHELEDVFREIQNAGDRLKIILKTHDEDVLFLANTPPIQGILRAQSAGGFDQQGKSSTAVWEKRLATIFTAQLQQKSAYLSIRFIDATGQELVVVSRHGQQIVAASKRQLQNKAHRDYVSEALKLPVGSVYVSEINLNREFGKVSEPRQEVIRSVTPVYNVTNSTLAGVVSITAEVGDELRAIQSRVRNTSDSEIYIANDRGDYLVHPDPSKTYGFEFGVSHNIQTDFPQLAKLFLTDSQNTQASFQIKRNGVRQIMDFSKVAFDINNPKRFIALVITHDYGRIAEEQSALLNNVVLWSLLLVIPGVGLGILFSVGLTRPIKQMTQVMDDYIHQRDTNETMPVHLNNEIGVMARIYQILIGQVEEAHAHLAEMNNKLEIRVTERTQALEMSELRQRSIVENIIDGLITIDSKGTVTSFNPAASKIFGYSTEEVLGKNINMLMPEPYTSEHDGYLHAYLNTGKKKIIGIGREVMGKRKDDTTFPMDLSVSEMMINGDRMFTGVVRDITERKQAEKELQAVTAIRQAILDGANYGIITTDKTGITQTFNRGAEKMLGYTADEIVGKQSPALWHDMDEIVARAKTLSKELDINIEPGFDVFTAEASRGISDENEWTYIRKNRSRFPVQLSITALRDTKGDINGFLGIASDITERKKVERMKSEFISTVSHELRTPLTSIRGALGLVLGKAADQLPEKLRNMVEMASRNSERLTLLINDILDLEKIESGRMEFEFAIVDLLPLAQQAVADNEGYAQQHQVQLVLESALEHAFIRADQHRLLQVFANLISNAVKYSPPHGQVTVSVVEHEGAYRVAVRDMGAGIPEEFRSRIFQRFAQADSSDTREKGGTGLGLSITKAIVDHHEGKIAYESELNKGTVFYFDLPIWHEAIHGEGKTRASIRVLICEDNPDVAAIIAEMLKPLGVVSDIAGTAGAARTLLKEHAYRLLLLDLNLPDQDGLDFLQELREAPTTTGLPVIVVSGRAQEGRMAFKGDAVTVVDWIQKPIEQDRLERALHEALRRTDRPHILHVEDDPDLVQVTKALLDDMADISHVPSLKEAREQLATHKFDLVLLDLGLADGSGVDLLDELKGRCPVVIFSAQNPSHDISVQVNAALTKSLTSNEQLLVTIKKILEG